MLGGVKSAKAAIARAAKGPILTSEEVQENIQKPVLKAIIKKYNEALEQAGITDISFNLTTAALADSGAITIQTTRPVINEIQMDNGKEYISVVGSHNSAEGRPLVIANTRDNYNDGASFEYHELSGENTMMKYIHCVTPKDIGIPYEGDKRAYINAIVAVTTAELEGYLDELNVIDRFLLAYLEPHEQLKLLEVAESLEAEASAPVTKASNTAPKQ